VKRTTSCGRPHSRLDDAPRYSSWTQKLRLRMSAAAKELSAGSFGQRSHKRSTSSVRAREGNGTMSPETAAAPGQKSRRLSEGGGTEAECGGHGGGMAEAERRHSADAVEAALQRVSTVPELPALGHPPGSDAPSAEKRTGCWSPVAAATDLSRGGVFEGDSGSRDENTFMDDEHPACRTLHAEVPLGDGRPILELIRMAESSGGAFHDELLLALRRRAALG